MENNEQGQKSGAGLAIPGAIVIAGLLIAGAVFMTNGGVAAGNKTGQAATVGADAGEQPSGLAPITAQDHIRGNPNAPIKIVEYSDPECPFCKQFHTTTMRSVMNDYGAQGQVAWVYRHFPLDQIHSKARNEMGALECANEVGGNAKFWEYLDRIFEVTPGNNGLDQNLLPTIATDVGLDKAKFTACQAENKFGAVIEADYQSGLAAGVRGTPYSVIIGKDGEQTLINGAQPYEVVKQMLDAALAK